MKRTKFFVTILIALLVSTPASAYYRIRTGGAVDIIMCGNGNSFPWPNSDGYDDNQLASMSVGICQGTVMPNDVPEIKKLNLTQREVKALTEKALELDKSKGAVKAKALGSKVKIVPLSKN